MPRLMLTDERWSKLRLIMKQFGIYDKPNLRQTVEGILYRMRVGCPWRDLPDYFGKWNTIYKTFNYWAKHNKLTQIFSALIKNLELATEFIDGSFVKAHQHSSGAASSDNEAIGKSKDGNNTKIHMVADSKGMPISFALSAGNINDSAIAPDLIAQLVSTQFLVADKGYDSEAIRALIYAKGANPIIPRKSNSTVGNADMNWDLYKSRHLVENLFARLKHFRAIATRYDKLQQNFKSIVALACGFLWLTA
jgi:transposase